MRHTMSHSGNWGKLGGSIGMGGPLAWGGGVVVSLPCDIPLSAYN